MFQSLAAKTFFVGLVFSIANPIEPALSADFLAGKFRSGKQVKAFGNDSEIANYVGTSELHEMRVFSSRPSDGLWYEFFRFPTRKKDCAPYANRVVTVKAQNTRQWPAWKSYELALRYAGNIKSDNLYYSNAHSRAVFVTAASNIVRGTVLLPKFLGDIKITCVQYIQSGTLSGLLGEILDQGHLIEKNIFESESFKELQSRVEELEKKLSEEGE